MFKELPELLQNQYKIESSALRRLVENFPWEDKAAYSQYLGQSYYYARESTRILALAGAKFDLRHNDLHLRFLEHAREERGHENLLLSDLRNLGYKIEDIPESAQMAAFYHNLYYWIEHVDPIALFGWVLNLEGFAVDCGEYLYDRVIKAHGLRAAAFLRVHAHEDVDHLNSALAFIRDLPADAIAKIHRNYFECSALFRSVLEHIVEQPAKRVA